jgi:hypothetical protein
MKLLYSDVSTSLFIKKNKDAKSTVPNIPRKKKQAKTLEPHLENLQRSNYHGKAARKTAKACWRYYIP